MADRRMRTIMVFAFVTGLSISAVIFMLYLLGLPSWAWVGVFVTLSIIQVSVSPIAYKAFYNSRIVDLPVWLRKRYPPLGYEDEDTEVQTDVILLRTPSAVLSGPDCGEAIGLGYLASVLRNHGLSVRVIDARLTGLDTMQVVELLLAYPTPMLGINLNFQYLAASASELIAALRSRGYKSHITLGGLYASVAYDEIMKTMPGVDTIVRFEGEHTYIELIQSILYPDQWSEIQGLIYRQNGSVVANPLRPLIPDLNTIPDPARDFLPLVTELGGYAYVVSSRGCHGTCAYCVQQRSVADPKGSRWRGRDPEEVANELQHLREEFGIRLFSFVDDDFFGTSLNGKNHAQRVAEALIRRNLDVSILLSVQPRDIDYDTFSLLKQAGVNSVILAVDNFSQPVLDRYKKFTSVAQNLHSIEILHSLGIDAYLGIIMWDSWTTLDEVIDNLKVMQNLPYLRPWQILSKLEIYHGSSISKELEQQGLLEWVGYSAKFQYIDQRIQGVYQAIETTMKMLHPSLMELDGFRWGNLSYSEADEWILKHFSSELEEINSGFNHQALGYAIEIVSRQQTSSDPISAEKLADPGLQKQVIVFNEQTVRALKELRRNALDHKGNAELEPAPAIATEV